MKRILSLCFLVLFCVASMPPKAAATPTNAYVVDPTPTLNDEEIDSLRKIDKCLNDARTGQNPLAGPVTATTFKLLVSGTCVIPANSNGWKWQVVAGTATVNGTAGIPAGVTDGRQTQNAAPITIITTGTVYISYN